MTGRDWDLRGERLIGFQFTEWLLIAGRSDNFTDEYMTDHDRGFEAARAYGWVDSVQEHPSSPRRLGQTPSPRPKLNAAGRLEVEKVRSLRNNPQARAEACREALLLWLRHEGRQAASADLMVARDDWRFYDDPFTVEEVNEAGKFLVERDLVRAVSVWGPDIVRPELTVRGQECVDFFGANVRDFLYPAQTGGTVTYNQNFHGTVSGQVGQGQNVTQTQNNGIDADALSAVFRAMREALSTVEDPYERDDVEHGIQQLEAAVQTGDAEMVTASAGRLQRLGARVGTAAGNTAITIAVTEGVKQLLSGLGLG